MNIDVADPKPLESVFQLDAAGRLKVESPLERYQEYKVVLQHELQGETQRGWKLVALLEETEYVMAMESEPTGGGQYGTVSVQRAKPHVFHRYLVGRDETSALTELTRRLEEKEVQQKETSAALAAARVTERDHDKLVAERDDLREKLQLGHEQHQGYQKLYQEKFRKYESDIAKLRAALGDIRMKEILGT